ncbi:cadherin-6-like isoform X1 [Sinocyclocheilus anshuiensis]|uniref:Cadherin-10 n=1 Tax=Sinocyclocheilus anshuiensis TaxID=1608454 RepID=A0A671Q3G4_9TELE|nr:PREDICTED: cadherin-6-like isoform X1 [Sinocyclocheilus anshuiensis]
MRTWIVLLLWACAQQSVNAVALSRGPVRRKTKEIEGRQDKELLRRSKRGWMWRQFFLQEEYTGTEHQYIGKLHSDMDRGDGTVMYVLTGEGAGTIFVIDVNSGDLHATRSLDREEKPYYALRAQAVDKKTGHPLEPETEFIVKLHDINDNEPKFDKEVYTASVPERSHIGTYVTQVTAQDADDEMFGYSAKLAYSISQGHPYFSVEPNTGIIRTALGPSDMDREQREHYQVVIEAKDMAGQKGGLTGSTTVNISLTDVNDNPPRFTQSIYQFSIPELTKVGSSVGRIRAVDADIGRNAEMDYTVVGGDGLDVFDISTDRNTQEGILSLKKPLDYEKKKSYTLQIKVQNTHSDPRFLSLDAKDMATIRVSVEDVDEPPQFEKVSYLMEVKEDAAVGTVIGSVSAVDPDIRRSPVKYSIDRHTDVDRIFGVYAGNGSIFLQRPLDREELAWHNISVIATEFRHLDNPEQTSRVPVYIRVLDVNDNPPMLASFYETFVCENAKAGQKIQTISAVDPDDPVGGHRFLFSLAPESSVRANFSVRDNGDNTAGIFTRRTGFGRMHKSTHLVSVVISDGHYPMQTSTGTLTIRVCTCDRDGNMEVCNAEALTSSAGLSTGALVAILLCILILLLIVVLFAALKRQKKKEPLIISKEDVRDNVVSYNDEGGGEEDTQAFDIGALRHPEVMEESKLRRDILPSESLYPPPPLRRTMVPSRENADVRDFINQRVQENDGNPTAPPYDSLATYAYEGNGSVAESLSSLGSMSSEGDQDYNYLSEWGPRFRKLADMYSGEDSDWDS